MTLSTLKARKNGLTRRTGAFTLIELIVVIVIIGILAAVAAVSYNSFIAGAEEASTESAAAQVSKTLQAESALEQDAYGTLDAVFVDKTLSTPVTAAAGTWAADAPAAVQYLEVKTNTAGTVTTMRYADDQFYCDVEFDATGVGTSPSTQADCTAIDSNTVLALP